jgi:hypothetical protein
MAYSPSGLNDALNGVKAGGTHLALCTGDPGTTGANIDVNVTPLPANWGTPDGDSVTSAEVPFAIPAGGGARIYTHFAVINGANPATATYKTGGPLDEAETFSDNGGTYNFTATLTAASAPAA